MRRKTREARRAHEMGKRDGIQGKYNNQFEYGSDGSEAYDEGWEPAWKRFMNWLFRFEKGEDDET